MIVAVDIGNSHIVLGCMDGASVRCIKRFLTASTFSVRACRAAMKAVLSADKAACGPFEGAVISSVVPSVTETVKEAVHQLTGRRALVIGPDTDKGIDIVTDDPRHLAADLVAGAVGALLTLAPPVIVIDMGTATTLTVVNGKGQLQGVVIMPGPDLSLKALADGAALLPRVFPEAPPRCIASNTTDSMKSGVIFGTAAALDGMTDRIEAELGEQAHVIATGGLASVVIPHCRRKIALDDALLLRGLAAIYNVNREKTGLV